MAGTESAAAGFCREGRYWILGCGYGWHCRYADGQGARRAGDGHFLKMLDTARKRRTLPGLNTGKRRWRNFPSRTAAGRCHQFTGAALCTGLQTAGGKRVPLAAAGGEFRVFLWSIRYLPLTGHRTGFTTVTARFCVFLDRYFEEGERIATFLGEQVIKYHRTLTTYLQTLWQAGFAIRKPGGTSAAGGYAVLSGNEGRTPPADDDTYRGEKSPYNPKKNK